MLGNAAGGRQFLSLLLFLQGDAVQLILTSSVLVHRTHLPSGVFQCVTTA